MFETLLIKRYLLAMKHVWSIYVAVFLGCLLHFVQAQNTTTSIDQFSNTFKGNWFNAAHQLEWVLGVHENTVVYKNQIWQYEKTTAISNTVNSITLVNDKQKTEIFVQSISEEACKIGSSTSTMVNCTNNLPNDLLKTQMSVPTFTYTSSSSYNNLAEIAVVTPSTEKNATCKISSAFGEFTPKDYRNNCYFFSIPVYFAQIISVNYTIDVNGRNYARASALYVTPGAKNNFFLNKNESKLIANKYRPNNKPYSQNICMGSNSNLNNVLLFLAQDANYNLQMLPPLPIEDSLNYDSPIGYRKTTTNYYNDNNQFIQKLYDNHIVDFQEYAILKKNLNAQYAENLFLFQLKVEIYKKYNLINIKTNNLSINLNVDSDTGYRQALIHALADSAILYSADSRNLLKTLLNKRNTKKPTTSIIKIIEQLQEKGTLLTNADIALHAQLKKAQMGIEDSSLDLAALEVATQEFKKRYRKQIEKYNDALNAKTELEYLQDYYQFPDWTHDLLLFYPIMNQIKNNPTDNEGLLFKYRESAKSKTITGIIDKEIRRIQKQPAIDGSIVMKTPRSNDYELLQAIAKQHEGKMILVDFWATWCAPCRAGMQTLAPLKEELKRDSVAFVNIASDNSPEDTWKTMIKQIRGFHYYLNADDWQMLLTQYNIKGIPRYMIINKKGNILSANYDVYENPEKLKRILLDKP